MTSLLDALRSAAALYFLLHRSSCLGSVLEAALIPKHEPLPLEPTRRPNRVTAPSPDHRVIEPDYPVRHKPALEAGANFATGSTSTAYFRFGSRLPSPKNNDVIKTESLATSNGNHDVKSASTSLSNYDSKTSSRETIDSVTETKLQNVDHSEDDDFVLLTPSASAKLPVENEFQFRPIVRERTQQFLSTPQEKSQQKDEYTAIKPTEQKHAAVRIKGNTQPKEEHFQIRKNRSLFIDIRLEGGFKPLILPVKINRGDSESSKAPMPRKSLARGFQVQTLGRFHPQPKFTLGPTKIVPEVLQKPIAEPTSLLQCSPSLLTITHTEQQYVTVVQTSTVHVVRTLSAPSLPVTTTLFLTSTQKLLECNPPRPRTVTLPPVTTTFTQTFTAYDSNCEQDGGVAYANGRGLA